ncbi:MAG TPA: TonB-dependent receptor [Cyclobacteriaceae bacterium]
MMKHYRFLTTIMFLTMSIGAWAQETVVKGRVTDASDGSGLPGVNILEKGTSNGSLTDNNGDYSISVQSGATLVFSFVGFESQEVSINGQTTLDISLDVDATQLDEVVVVGYGELKREDLTGSVTAINSRDFNKGVLTSPQDLLVGKLAGVQVTSNSGAPGSGSTIRIRGGSSLSASNDPLIVIDGFPVDNKVIGGAANPLASINPNDIETFTVLKDASATAIYGSRASNGVIIITTKKGKEGKMNVSYNGNVSVGSPIEYFDVLSADELRALAADVANRGTVSGLNATALERLGDADTDWQKQIYRDAVSHDHNLALSGTAGNIPYRVSYGFTDQQGILETTSSKRHSLNLNISPSFLEEHLKVNVSAKASNTRNNFGNTGAVGAAVGFDPTQPITNGNTRWGGYFAWTQDPDDPDSDPVDLSPSNPVALLAQTTNTSEVNRLLGNIQIDYRFHFLPDLRVNVNAGLDYAKSDGINNTSLNAPWATDPGEGQKIDYTGENKSKLFDLYLNYVKELGESRIDATAGYSYQSFENTGSNYSRNWDQTKFYDSEVNEEAQNVARQYVPELNYLLSFFGRVNYSYKNRYLLTVTYRTDGSSRFSEENRWGSFPAAALAWNASNEPFLADAGFLSNLKVRVGYGVTGQQNINIPGSPNSSYPFLPVYQSSTNTARYQFGDALYYTLRPNAYDGNIKWEETTTYNAGIDFGIIDDKLTGTIDVYQRETKDLLNNIQVAGGSNFSNFLWTNVGSLENTGVEVTLNARAIDTEDITWNIGFNFTSNTNEITGLLRTTDPNYEGVATGSISGGVGNMVQIHTVGSPANSFYVFQQVWGDDGLPIEGLYVDRTGDGGSVSSNGKNKYHYNSPYPDMLMGINTSLRYKRFDLYLSGRISLRNYVYNNRASGNTYSALYINTGYFNNVARGIFKTEFINPQYWSDIYVEDASFFKMDNISLGYNVDRVISERLKARFSFTVQNAFTVTDYSGIDPEVNDGFNPGIDNNIYPRSRNFILGVNLTY